MQSLSPDTACQAFGLSIPPERGCVRSTSRSAFPAGAPSDHRTACARTTLSQLARMGLIVLWILGGEASAPAQTVITVDPGSRHQTIQGWEAVAWAAQDASAAFDNYRDELFQRAISEVGITRLRLEVRSGAENTLDYWALYQQGQVDYDTWRANRYATVNDDADPNRAEPGGFHFSELDNTVEKVVLPFRRMAEAQGQGVYVNLNYVAFTGQITAGGAYHHQDPAEYGEFMLAAFQHLDQRFGFVPDGIEILLEPDNVSQWNGNLIGRSIVATAGRLEASGYDCEFIAPSCTSMANAVPYFDGLAAVPGALALIDELSYHRYGGVSTPNLQLIAGRAAQHALRTSMLEWWSDANGPDIFLADLQTGNAAAWEHGVLGGPGTGLDNSMTLYRVNDTNPGAPVVSLNRKAQLLRQYYRFVRPGAVRLGAGTTSGTFNPVAFVHPQDGHVVVVRAAGAGSFSIQGLPAGTYALCYSTPATYDVRLPDQVVSQGGAVTASMPRDGVFTAYAKTVRILEAALRDGSVWFQVASPVPDAALEIQRAIDPSDPVGWSAVGQLDLNGLQETWSEPWGEDWDKAFYRVVFR